jgi:PAS domain S-box-containing protein
MTSPTTPPAPPAPPADAPLPADPYLRALHESALDLMNRRDVAGVISAILGRAAALAETEHGCVYLVEDDETLRPDVAIGLFEGLNRSRVEKGVGLAGCAWVAAEPIVVDEYDEFPGRDPEFPTGVLHASLGVPLTAADGSVIGLMGLGHTDPDRRFGTLDVQRMSAFGQLAAVALENDRLLEATRREATEVARAQDALRRTEENYRRLVELSPDAIMVHVDDRIVFANPRFAAMIRVADPAALIGRQTAELIDPDVADTIIPAIQRVAIGGGPLPLTDTRLQRVDGSSFEVEMAASPLVFEGRRGAQLVFRDASERKATEQALQDAESQFRDLVEHLPVVTYRDALDDVTSLYVSPQIERLIGYTPAEWIGSNSVWKQALHPDDRDAALAENERTGRSGDPFVMNYRMVARDGRVVWVHDESRLVYDDDGQPRFWQGIMVDVTERTVAQQALEVAEAKYRSLVERLPAVSYTVNDPRRPDDPSEGLVPDEYVSPQIQDLIGCSPDEWLADQTAWRRYVHPDDVAMVIDRWHRDSAAGDLFDLEYRMVAKDGRVVWVHDQAALVREVSGEPHLWQGIMLDVTERREAEEALKEAFEQEREVSERLRALDEMKNTFLAAVSHELRTPLSAILGMALTLEREDLELPPDDVRDLLRRLASNARKLDRLLSDLLDLDRLIRGIVEPRRRPTDIGALVRQVVDGADPARGRTIELDLEPVTASVDPAQVERIVENLVTNAARYTPPGSPITVRVRSAGDGVTIAVDDEGPGIPAGLREAVFEPFRQVPGRNPHAPGVGIGLSLVARFAQLHGGAAWVQDRETGGSSFRVLLRDAGPESDSLSESAKARPVTKPDARP